MRQVAPAQHRAAVMVALYHVWIARFAHTIARLGLNAPLVFVQCTTEMHHAQRAAPFGPPHKTGHICISPAHCLLRQDGGEDQWHIFGKAVDQIIR